MNIFVGEICHIEASSPKGPRYNKSQTNEERHSCENLIPLCHTHHRIIDTQIEKFSVKKLQEIKQNHESNFKENKILVNDEIVNQALKESFKYWAKIEGICEEDDTGVLLGADSNASFESLIENSKVQLNKLKDSFDQIVLSQDDVQKEIMIFLTNLGYDVKKIEDVKYYDDPLSFFYKNFDNYCLYIPNTFLLLERNIYQAEIKFYEQKLLSKNCTDLDKKKYKELKEKFTNKIKGTYIND